MAIQIRAKRENYARYGSTIPTKWQICREEEIGKLLKITHLSGLDLLNILKKDKNIEIKKYITDGEKLKQRQAIKQEKKQKVENKPKRTYKKRGING